ncbi:Homeobox-leucine zipper protein ROC8 [Hordeum vulgare]|nr:Homeobox-leucine zipper protein ROC8 [Hordeum vulgare]
MKNARLKQELDHVAGLTAKYLCRPFTHMPQGTPQMSVSSLDLSMGRVPMSGHHQPFGCGGGMWRDLDLLSGAGLGLPSSDMPAMHLPAPVTDAERPLMARMAARAMDNSIYSKLSSSNFRAGDIRVEGSQDTAVVCMTPSPSSKCSWTTPSTPKHHVPRADH